MFTSPLQRCVLTGGKIAAACGIKGEVREGLGDIDYGVWQMRTHDEVSAESPEAYRQWRSAPQLTRFPKGKSLQDVMARGERRGARGAFALSRADGRAGRP